MSCSNVMCLSKCCWTSVTNNSINNDHVKAFHNLLYQAMIDCHLLAQATTEISIQLEELDSQLKSK